MAPAANGRRKGIVAVAIEANRRTIAPPIGSTKPLKLPMANAFQRLFPSLRSGMEIMAPSGMFCMAIPNERAHAPAVLKSDATAPAMATPTAIPSGKLCIVTANANIVVRERWLRGPSTSPWG